jgi:hypothetical protein
MTKMARGAGFPDGDNGNGGGEPQEKIDVSETTVAETTEGLAATVAASWAANVKEAFEQVIVQTATQAAERAIDAKREVEYVDGWKALALRQAEANHQLVLQVATNNAALANRVNNDGASVSARLANAGMFWDNFLNSEAINNQNVAQSASDRMQAETAKGLQDTVKAAMDAAVANAGQANPVAMGTSGVNQGAMQTAKAISTDALADSVAAMQIQLAATNNAIQIANTAIAAQISKLAELVTVLNLKVAGDVAVAPRV